MSQPIEHNIFNTFQTPPLATSAACPTPTPAVSASVSASRARLRNWRLLSNNSWPWDSSNSRYGSESPSKVNWINQEIKSHLRKSNSPSSCSWRTHRSARPTATPRPTPRTGGSSERSSSKRVEVVGKEEEPGLCICPPLTLWFVSDCLLFLVWLCAGRYSDTFSQWRCSNFHHLCRLVWNICQ